MTSHHDESIKSSDPLYNFYSLQNSHISYPNHESSSKTTNDTYVRNNHHDINNSTNKRFVTNSLRNMLQSSNQKVSQSMGNLPRGRGVASSSLLRETLLKVKASTHSSINFSEIFINNLNDDDDDDQDHDRNFDGQNPEREKQKGQCTDTLSKITLLPPSEQKSISATNSNSTSTFISQSVQNVPQISKNSDSPKTSSTPSEKNNTLNKTGIRIVMCLIAIIEVFSEGMVIPYFPRAMNINVGLFGFLLATNAISKLVSSIIVGLYIAEFGPKKTICFSMFLNIASMVLMGFCPWIRQNSFRNSPMSQEYSNALSTFLSFISFILLGSSAGGYMTASSIIVIEVFPDTFSEEIGFYEIFSGLGSGVSPLLAGLLLQYVSDNFVLVGILGATVGSVCLFFSVKNLKEIKNATPSRIRDSLKLLKSSHMQVAFVALLFGFASMPAMGALLESHVSQFFDADNQAFKVGLPMSIASFGYAISCPFWGKYASNNPRNSLIIGTFFLSFCMFSFDPRKIVNGNWDFLKFQSQNQNVKNQISYVLFNLSMAILGLCLGAPIIATYQEMYDTAIHKLKIELTLGNLGLISTVWNLGYACSSVAGPTVFGSLAQIFDFYWSTRIFGFILLILLLFMLVFYQIEKQQIMRQKSQIREEEIAIEVSS